MAVQIRLPDRWFCELSQCLDKAKVFNRACWLKSVSGGWNTTIRMHEEIKWSCIFGCLDEQDCLRHYLVCPVLWTIANSILGGEDSISVGERLCLRNPSQLKLQRLSLVHHIYHFCKNDPTCTANGHPASPLLVQSRGSEVAFSAKHLIA